MMNGAMDIYVGILGSIKRCPGLLKVHGRMTSVRNVLYCLSVRAAEETLGNVVEIFNKRMRDARSVNSVLFTIPRIAR